MKFTALILAILCTVSLPVFAQEEDGQAVINWGRLESSGTLQSTREGALPKTLWEDQNRSDILSLMSRMPVGADYLTAQNIKKRLLLSRSNADLIENDIPLAPQTNLFTLRLKKLIDMGLYDEAFDLYTQTVEDPEFSELAELGILLMIKRGDLATACLEEKVLAARWPDNLFWTQIDSVCNLKISNREAQDPVFIEESSVLQALYTSPDYSVPATSVEDFREMSPLEFSLVVYEGKIDYRPLEQASEEMTDLPSSLLMAFYKDANIPENLKQEIEVEAVSRSLIPGPIPQIPEDLPVEITKKELLAGMARFLINGQSVPDILVERLLEFAPENPENYAYLHVLQILNATDMNLNISVENWTKGLNALDLNKAEQVLAITTRLDNGNKSFNNPFQIYEKRLSLTLDGDYVMPSVGLIQQLEGATSQGKTGTVLLTVLNILDPETGKLYPGITEKVLESLLSVGFTGEAQILAREILARNMIN